MLVLFTHAHNHAHARPRTMVSLPPGARPYKHAPAPAPAPALPLLSRGVAATPAAASAATRPHTDRQQWRCLAQAPTALPIGLEVDEVKADGLCPLRPGPGAKLLCSAAPRTQ